MHSLHVFYSPTFGDARKTEGLSLNRADFSQIGPFLPVFTRKLLQKLFKLLENVKEDHSYATYFAFVVLLQRATF